MGTDLLSHFDCCEPLRLRSNRKKGSFSILRTLIKQILSAFLCKASTSQLTLLTDDAYTAGLRRIEAMLAAAEVNGKTIEFASDLRLEIVTGRVKR